MSIFTIVLVGEFRGKDWRHIVENVEVAEKHQSESPNSTEPWMAMSDDTMFIHPPMLVVLCVVSKCSRDLHVHSC